MRTAVAGVMGGISAKITGGRFEDGAVSAAFRWLFNDWFKRYDRDEKPVEKIQYPDNSNTEYARAIAYYSSLSNWEKFTYNIGVLTDRFIGMLSDKFHFLSPTYIYNDIAYDAESKSLREAISACGIVNKGCTVVGMALAPHDDINVTAGAASLQGGKVGVAAGVVGTLNTVIQEH